MREIIINARELKNREDAHAYLAKALLLPPYYGNNLDALHDCLTEINEQTHIIVYHSREIALYLGLYGDALVQVLKESAAEADLLTVSLLDDPEPSAEGSAEN